MSEVGHEPTFSALKNTVGFPLETRHSASNVRNPLVNGPSGAAKRRSGLCQMPTLVDAAANFRFEPIVAMARR